MDSPTPTIWYRSQFFDVYVNQLAWPFAYITFWGCPCGTVTASEVTQTGFVEDLLHSGGRRTDFVSDPSRTPTTVLAQFDHFGLFNRWGAPE